MKQPFNALLLLVALGACRDKEVAPDADATLVGRWQLSGRQCYCPAGPVPNETLIFDTKGGFQFFRDGKLANEGSYLTSVGEVCSGAPRQPLVQFAGVSSSSGSFVGNGSYTLTGSTLVIDQGTYCLPDVAISTYQRVP